MGNMSTGGTGNQPQPSSNDAMDSMKGMVHPTSGTHIMAESHRHELMLMSDGMMDIRVGTSHTTLWRWGRWAPGTAWQPTTTPMYMWSKVLDKWLLFIHADAKIGVNSQGGPRGVTKFESQNWIMPMAFRRVGRGTLQLRGMFSLEPFTFSPGGSPQLFQTGETYQGRPLVDKQHPHDLFMELSATYTRANWRAWEVVRLCWLSRRTVFRADGFYAPRLGVGESNCAARAPLAGFVAHLLRRLLHGLHLSLVQNRRLAL